MAKDYIQEIIACHKSKGMIEQNAGVTIIDNNLVKFNKFTLKISKIKASDLDINYYNANITKELKKDSNFYKEIREFNQLFKFFEKMNIRNGYIRKIETPDFEFSKDGVTYGIEVTRIYTSNDWVAENIHTDIVAYKLNDKSFKDYMNKSKYAMRVKTILTNAGKIKVEPYKDKKFSDAEVAQIKNKLFEKIRKQFDDYQKFDCNYIFAEIVYTGYKDFESYDKLNDEINYFVNHLDLSFGEKEFHLILKNGNNFIDFDLCEGHYFVF